MMVDGAGMQAMNEWMEKRMRERVLYLMLLA
jgi:hypothetical protein